MYLLQEHYMGMIYYYVNGPIFALGNLTYGIFFPPFGGERRAACQHKV